MGWHEAKANTMAWVCLGIFLSFIPRIAASQEPTFDGVLRGHLGTVFMGIFTPDGRRAITVSSDETARYWDLKTGEEVKRFRGHTGPVYCAALSGDGRTLVTGAQDNSLLLWDLPQTRSLWSFAAHPGSAEAFRTSLDGTRWLTAGDDKLVRLWDAKILKSTASKPNVDFKTLDLNTVSAARPGHEHPIRATAIRSDGSLFASGDASGRILLWSPYVATVQGSLGIHAGGITGLVFHSNNQQLISAGNDGMVRVWQLPPPVTPNAEGVTTGVRDLTVVPGQPLAIVATDDQVTRLIDLNSGKAVRDFPRAEAPISALAIAPNSSLLAIADEAGKTRIVNFADAAPRFELAGHPGAVRDAVFHPDVQSLFTAGVDGTVRRWQIPPVEGKSDPLRTWEGITGGAQAIRLSADGARLAVGGGDGAIRIYLSADGALEKTLSGHTEAITELAFVGNQLQLVSASRDKSIRHWDLQSGQLLRTLVHPTAVTGVTVSNNGARIASAAEDGTVRVWDAQNGRALQEFSGHAAGIAQAQWLHDNQTIISGSVDRSLRTWKPSILNAFAVHEKPVLDIALFNGGSHVVSCSSDGRVVMSDLSNGQETRKFEGLSGAPRVVAIRNDNQRLAVGSSEGKLGIWNTNDAQLLQTLSVQGAVTSLSWSSDNQKLAVATDQQLLYFFGPPLPPQTPQPGSELVEHQKASTDSVLSRVAWDAEQRSVMATQADGRVASWSYAAPIPTRRFAHGGPVQSVAISRDGKMVVSASADQTVRIWDAVTGQQRAQLNGHVGQVLAVALSPDESVIVSSGADHTVRLWDATSGTQLKQLATFQESMYSVAMHPNGQTVAAGGADRRVHLLNILTGAVDRVLEGHTDYVHSVQFNSTGTKLLSYSYAGDLRCWDVTSGQLLSQQRVGRVGNFASYSPDNARALLSNGDDTARVIELPAEAR